MPFSVFAFSPSAHILELPSDGPAATPRLLVSSTEGVFLSSDLGATWVPVAGGLESSFRPALASDASGSLVLAGTDTQVFRSQDRGDSWVSSQAGLKSVWISALALDPRNPSTVWAGGIGNWGSGPGLFRSTDAGLSWSPAGGPQGPRGVNAMAIDPEHLSTVYAGSQAVYRTEDGGQTWTFSVPDPVQGMNVLALDPDLPQRVWAGTHSGLFRSDDGARTWEPPSIAQGVYSILFDGRHPGTVYAGSYWDVDFDYYGIYGGSIFVSHDGGASFTKGTYEFGDGVLSIAQDPFQNGVLYVAAATAGVFRSADGGVTWESSERGAAQSRLFREFLHHRPSDRRRSGPARPPVLLHRRRRVPDDRRRSNLATLFRWPGATLDRDARHLAGRKERCTPAPWEAASSTIRSSRAPWIFRWAATTDTRLLGTDVDGRIELRSLDGSGALVSSASYGQYTGWIARAVADGSDGLTRVLWNNPDGSTGLQLLGPTGDQVSDHRYGRVGSWTAVDVSVGPDNTTHLLWTNTDGRMGLGSLDGSGALVNGPSYGPYSGWLAQSIAHGADGLTRVLWTRTDGTVGLSFFGAGGIFATHRFAPVSGPASGWTARDIAVASDNKTRILWAHSDGRMTLWSVDNSGAVTDSESVYEHPASGQAATRISAGADGLTRVLWTSPGGTGTVWLLSLDNVFQSSFGLKLRKPMKNVIHNRIRRLLPFVVLVAVASTASTASAGMNTWTTSGPEGGAIGALAIDPVNPTTLYASVSGGGVFKSTDSGGSWAAVNSGSDRPPISATWRSTLRRPPRSMPARTEGVFKSTNGGASWTAINTGLTSLDVNDLAIDSSAPATLYAGGR